MNFDQGKFDFEQSGSEEGYRHWQERLDAERRTFESRWGVVLGRKVRLLLRDHDRPVEGVIRLVDLKEKTGRPILSLGHLEFSPSEIESIVALEDST